MSGRFYEDTTLASLQARVEREIEEEIEAQGIPALQLAIYGERERIELAFGSEGPEREELIGVDRRFRIGGVTKLYTAVVLLSLVEEGRLSLEQSVEGWFPELPDAESVTIGALLQERSGFAEYTDRDFARVGLILRNGRNWERDELLRRIRRGGRQRESADDDREARSTAMGGNHNQSDYVLLGLIAERVTGEVFSQLLDRYIAEPLQLENTALPRGGGPGLLPGYDYDLIPFGNHRIEATNSAIGSWAFSAGGVVADAGEMALFFSALHEGRLLSRESLDLMIKEAMGPRQVEVAGELLLGRSGSVPGFGALLYQWPDRNLTIAIAANRSRVDHAALLTAVVAALNR